jgi:hypothetical protein
MDQKDWIDPMNEIAGEGSLATGSPRFASISFKERRSS